MNKKINIISLLCSTLIFTIYLIAYALSQSSPNELNIGSGLLLVTYFFFSWIDEGFTESIMSGSSGESFPVALVLIICGITYVIVYAVLTVFKLALKTVFKKEIFRSRHQNL